MTNPASLWYPQPMVAVNPKKKFGIDGLPDMEVVRERRKEIRVMARICGVCQLAPREGDEMFPIRIGKRDLKSAGVEEEGLYSACLECVEKHRKRTAKRMGMEVTDVPNNMMC